VMEIRDRVQELKRVSASELLDHEGNPRSHPIAQRNAFRGILAEIGIAGALLGYYSDRNDGKLTLVDGHMRKAEHAGEWPVLILDLTDQEADKLLAFYDPISGMAEILSDKMGDLAAKVSTGNPDLQAILDRQAAEADLADVMAMVSQELEEMEGCGSSIDGAGLQSARAKVRPVIWVDDLPTFERAIRAVENPNRGEAMIAICAFYLENHDAKG
jgi:hypothetical protein